MLNNSSASKECTKSRSTPQVGGTDDSLHQAADITAFLERRTSHDRVAVPKAPWDVTTGLYTRVDGTTVYISNPHHFQPSVGTHTSTEAVAGDEALVASNSRLPGTK